MSAATRLTAFTVSISLALSVFATGIRAVEKDLAMTARTGTRIQSIYRSHENSKNKIALTFDDGPHEKYTPEILEILKEYDAHATFFTVGSNVDKLPELVESIQRDGHEIGNHTYTHAYLTKERRGTILSEIIDAERSVTEKTDCRPKLLRPPGGLINNDVCEIITALDYEIIMWSIDTRDWAHTPAADIAGDILSNVKSGDIILFHDFIAKASPTPEALRLILPELTERGFKFVTVSELIGTM